MRVWDICKSLWFFSQYSCQFCRSGFISDDIFIRCDAANCRMMSDLLSFILIHYSHASKQVKQYLLFRGCVIYSWVTSAMKFTGPFNRFIRDYVVTNKENIRNVKGIDATSWGIIHMCKWRKEYFEHIWNSGASYENSGLYKTYRGNNEPKHDLDG